MRTILGSSLLQFTRDGRHLVLAEPDALVIEAVDGTPRRRVELSAIQSIAAFTDQVWVATRAGTLVRLTLDGRTIGEHALQGDVAATLIPTTVGAPAAMWTTSQPTIIVDDLGALAFLDVDADAVVPVAGRRYVRAVGARVTLPTGAICTLVNGARIASACVLFDGTSLLALADHQGRRTAMLIALSSGRIQQTLMLPSEPLAIAARRGLAVLRQAPDRLELIDLRFGRSLGVVVVDADVDDVAIDPDGTQLAIRLPGGAVELASIGERMAATVRAGIAVHGDADDSGPVEPVAPPVAVACEAERARAVEPEPDEQAAPEPSFRPTAAWPRVVVDSLDPRPPRARVTRIEALDELDREIRSVMLWTLQAIAGAWDSRRLGYGNEGTHPYEHEVAALVGMNGGFATDYLAAARSALAAHERELALHAAYRGSAMPLAELADELGLSATAIDILLVIAAPALHGEVARMYGILANDPGRALVDQRLVEQILEGRVNRHDIAAELHPRSPLVRLGIVEARARRPGPFAALEIDGVILARLRGEPPELGTAPIVRDADRELGELELAPGVCERAI
ncbi:MAG: hypothetical protein H0T89_31420, partial [Deltaproteobacteria bacterium]|nr:hypothetical protein [Deltaproteobacteria bacterium]